MKNIYVIIVYLILALGLSAYQADVKFTDNWDKQGLRIEEQNDDNLKLNYSITQFYFEDIAIDNENLTNIQLPGVFLPNDEGMPNLPGIGRYIALPQGAKAELHIIDYRIERYSDIEIAPAPRIPLDTETGPLEYNKNNETYSKNANYPENFIQLSEPSKLRGVDVVMLGITPFQYNPVTKELIVYRDIKFEVSFSGGNGHFGEDRLRNRWWDPIIKNAVVNYASIPQIDYNVQTLNRDGAEYLIICQDDPDFLTWADSIRVFRQQQGISTMIETISEVGGNTVTAIEDYVDNAYNTWTNPPAAVLLLGDYGTETSGIVSQWYTHPAGFPDFVSDNKFADVDGDDLPDIVFARITANDATQLEVMITKFLDYERNPPIDTDFYNHPITALGWQTERWFQICSEVVGGYLSSQGKNPVRINAVYDGNPSVDPWSTAPNTATVVNYFGPSGLDYIPATPLELGGFSGGTATDVVDAINAGSFMLQHRDHGDYTGWGEPAFTSTNINSLTNVDNKLPFIFSINCQTGAFHRSSECFAEKFHRYTYDGQNSGALGIIAATEISYSFVNDTYMWGVMDNLFPDFMPAETTEFPTNYVLPAFGNAAGKHFLHQSSWPYVPSVKQITYRLFHHHGDAFLNVYTEVPQNLTVSHAPTLLAGSTTFDVTADDGAFIALTIDGEIIGTVYGTGSTVSIIIPALFPPSQVLVTVTKQNFYRYSATVDIIEPPSGHYVVIYNCTVDSGGNNIIEAGETTYLTITLKNIGDALAENVNMVLSVSDDYITLIDDTKDFGTIDVDESVTGTNAYTFTVSSSIPNNHPIHFDALINCDEDSWNSNIDLTASNPADITVNPIQLDENLQPNQISPNNLNIGNSGGATLDYTATISYAGRDITVYTSEVDMKRSNTNTFFNTNKNAPFQYDPSNYPSPTRQGGDTVASALVISSLPYNDAGTTVGYVNDYDEVCNYTGSTSPDVVYSYTPTVDVINGFVSLCGDTDYDSKLYIYESTVTQGSSFACNDDACVSALGQNYLSELTGLSFTVGSTYYIVVDGYGGASGNYEIDITGDIDRTWLTLDGSNEVIGSISSGSANNVITVGFDSTDLTEGIYTANITITSNDPDEPTIIIPVTLNVSGQLDPPVNVQIQIVNGNVQLSWDVVSGATTYHIYYSTEPFTGFTELDISVTNSYEHINGVVETKLFYYITAE